jgi:cis-3-alkyl-4-acyloxetan-2-one decarboxylase
MVPNLISDYYHLLLKRPYRLKVIKDTGESNKPVLLLLHGIASDSSTWNKLYPLASKDYRVIAVDLLGFGKSPKPTAQSYSLDCHSKSILFTLKKLKINNNLTVIGHSMGGLIALELATINPKLIKKIITVGMPLYDKSDTINTKTKIISKDTTNNLFRVYDYLIDNKELTLKRAQKIMAIKFKVRPFKLTQDTWIPFKKSLKQSVMNQNVLKAISNLKQPIWLLYGTLDVFIVAKNYKKIPKSNNVSIKTYIGGHLITQSVVKQILIALNSNN